jgi:hypothetical protein
MDTLVDAPTSHPVDRILLRLSFDAVPHRASCSPASSVLYDRLTHQNSLRVLN